ncbi:MAG: nitrate reductase [Elusimicrobia bacterium RIFCSPLOWO2_02_FULL_39_32]|nr:MAG: nitrate reductase [Elusimicrobia bacterium RIFCSPHIGHO2_02_FULL_39_36]OGR91928.1 MAG: nitrate reductase [Elusimicrobia bacterium RIFCSPLOWO2_02_FULL_39_32]OGR98779.1 MAG: nitrate reductase [Elusimicrobia bacterium RIFCSPLOWO2_12_FULL_39_28]
MGILKQFFYQESGPLTRELLLDPGKFGLGMVPANSSPDATTTMVCGYCSVGCGLRIHLKNNEAVNLSPDTDYPVNLGMACPKGWEALSPLKAADRATTPYLRSPDNKLKPIDWNTALNIFTQRFKAIQEKYGAESVAFLSTGQIVMEEMAFLGALAKFGLGMVHGDGNTRQCMATAVVAYKQSFGFDAPPYTYKDFEQSDVIILVGSNLCIAHPILWERICKNLNHPEIIVVDPRLTETAMAATQRYPLLPKSDLSFFYGIARILIEKGWVDHSYIENHTNGFNEFSKHLESFTPDRVSKETGISKDKLYQMAETIHKGQRVSFWWTMGVNQSHEGVRLAQSLINLALMTGNIGKPGTGANSITGQCNAMGSRLYSNTTNLLGCHDFLNALDREKVAQILGLDVSRIPQVNSWAYDQIIEGIGAGKIKGLWVIATNTSHSWIHQSFVNELLKELDFLVVQDMYYTTETAQVADLLLPATGWGEKEGCFINSERRIGRVKKVAKAPGQALSDFNIFRLIAEHWGCGELFKEWSSPEHVFQILKRISKGTPADISGIRDYAMIDEAGGIQWPYPEGLETKEKERRLFEDGRYYTKDSKAQFIFSDPQPMSEIPSQEYPFLLLTGRGSSSQWHTQTRTKKSEVLKKLYPQQIYMEMNPEDGEARGIKPNSWVYVESRRGKIKAKAYLTPTIQLGQLFIPMHYHTTNRLTNPSFDPYSRQPSYKACAVNVRRIEHWEGDEEE